jgi:hypothetical protein
MMLMHLGANTFAWELLEELLSSPSIDNLNLLRCYATILASEILLSRKRELNQNTTFKSSITMSS